MDSAIPSGRARADLLRWAGQVVLLAILYFAGGRLGLELAHHHDNATLVWPPTGLALAALILFGRRLWPGVFVGALLLNGYTGLGWLASLGIASGNTLEALVGVSLLRVADFRPTLERLRDVVVFLGAGVAGCTTVSATIGIVTLLVSGGLEAADTGTVWLIWWLGDVGGALVVTPALLMLVKGSPPWRSLAGRIEFWLALALLLATSAFAFFGPVPGLSGFAASVAPFPVLVWAGTRLGPRGAALASAIIIASATLAISLGSGPFVMGSGSEAMILLWAYSIFIGMTAFTLAAVIEQRDLADRMYRSGESERLGAEKERLLLLERERLTREMHDGLGGQLVSVLSMVERGVGTPQEVSEALRRALDDIRIVIDSLDPDTTDLPTSLGKLRARLEPLLRRNGMALDWQIDPVPGLDAFPPEAALNLLRVIQEAATNAMRHASAKQVEVRVSACDDRDRWLRVTIRDDGCGLPTGLSPAGRGIRNMHARAERLAGELRIESANPGTRVELRVPLFSGG